MPLYMKTGSSAIDIKALQIGTKRQIPIYETTTTTKTGPTCNYANLNEYFTVTQGSSYGWTLSENTSSVKLVPQNFGINSSTATITLTATRNISNLVITGAYYTESNYDKITLTVAGSTKLSAVSGTSALATRVSGVSITKGQTVIFTYAKDSSSHASSETSTYFTLTCDPYTETVTTEVITGYTEKLLPTDIIGGWIKKSGVARQFFSAGPNAVYTGTHTLTQIEKDGVTYNLLTMTGSGVLTIEEGSMQAWICGGGSGGETGITTTSYYNVYSGRGGCGGYVSARELAPGVYTVTIGAGGTYDAEGGATSIQDANAAVMLAANGGTLTKGASGGGAPAGYSSSYTEAMGSAGKGQGVTTIPFGIEALQPHSAGGGAGEMFSQTYGGDGGSDGSDGGSEEGSSLGGNKGGGKGATGSDVYRGRNATFYGSAGGGGRLVGSSDISPNVHGGSGYQGVGYVLWQDDGILYDWILFHFIQHPVGGVTPCTMTVEAAGEGVSYQWQSYSLYGGWRDISGATSNTYTGTAGTSYYSSTKYRCKATDANGTVIYSDEAIVTKS